MAIIKKNELKKLDKQSLQNKLIDLKKELMKFNTQISTGTLPENPGKIKEIKRTIAKIIFTLDKFKQNKEEKKKVWVAYVPPVDYQKRFAHVKP